MEELSITYQPREHLSLYAPYIRSDGMRIGQIVAETDERESPMTFPQLLGAIAQLIKQYLKGKRKCQ